MEAQATKRKKQVDKQVCQEVVLNTERTEVIYERPEINPRNVQDMIEFKRSIIHLIEKDDILPLKYQPDRSDHYKRKKQKNDTANTIMIQVPEKKRRGRKPKNGPIEEELAQQLDEKIAEKAEKPKDQEVKEKGKKQSEVKIVLTPVDNKQSMTPKITLKKVKDESNQTPEGQPA